jgi:hypothetical protein
MFVPVTRFRVFAAGGRALSAVACQQDREGGQGKNQRKQERKAWMDMRSDTARGLTNERNSCPQKKRQEKRKGPALDGGAGSQAG